MRRYYLKPRPRSDDPPLWALVLGVVVVAIAVLVLEWHGAPNLISIPVYALLGGLAGWTICECVMRLRKRRRA